MRDLDGGFSTLVNDLEWPMLLITLDICLVDLATHETFSVEDGVLGIGVVCVFSAVTDTAGDII